MRTRTMKHFLPKTLWNLGLIAGVLLAFNSRAAGGPNTRTGKVIDAKGAPVAEATVDCYEYPVRILGPSEMEVKQHATSDSKGAFTFSPTESPIVIVAKKAGMAVGWKVWIPAQAPGDFTIVLSAPAPLAGTVV